MRIEIKAFDTLFFRDGKPFTMEDESWAEGIFPPPPSVIYGALRAAYFANHPDELSKANESDDPTKKLKITNISFLRTKESKDFFYPLPADFTVKEIKKADYEKDDMKDENGYEPHRMKINMKHYSSKPLFPLCADPEEDKLESSAGFYLTRYGLEKYLQGAEFDKKMIMNLGENILIEPKIGIGRNYQTKTSNDGRLYRLGMRRLENRNFADISFMVEFEGMELPESGIIRLGGEGKTASYTTSQINSLPKKDPDKRSCKFILYFMTPALFEKNGYYPDFFDDKFSSEINGRKYRIVSMAMDKPLSIGGWDMKANRPKPMKKFVPAGSVYIVECDSEISINDFDKDFATKEFCKEEYAKQGYGLYLTGVYND